MYLAILVVILMISLPFAGIAYFRHQIAAGEFGGEVTLNVTDIANSTANLTSTFTKQPSHVYDEIKENMK